MTSWSNGLEHGPHEMGDYLDLPWTNAQQIYGEVTVGISAVATKVLPADPSRIYVRFLDTSGSVLLGGSNVSVTGAGRLWINSTALFIDDAYRIAGIEVQQEWWAVRPSGISTLSIMTIRWQPVPNLSH